MRKKPKDCNCKSLKSIVRQVHATSLVLSLSQAAGELQNKTNLTDSQAAVKC